MQGMTNDIAIINDLVDRNCFAVYRNLACLYGIALRKVSPARCLKAGELIYIIGLRSVSEFCGEDIN